MKNLLLQSIWLMLPAAVANMSPVLFKWLPFLDIPVDLNKKWNGRPILGEHKTYRGFLTGTLMAIATVYMQKYYAEGMRAYSILDYSHINVILVGFCLGFGGLFGDTFKSFLKRLANVEPGKPWPPFDQIDWIVGGLVFLSFYKTIPFLVWLVSIAFFGLLHPVVNYIGYLLHFKKNKF